MMADSVTPDRENVTRVCATCGQQVHAEQGVYSITGEHWDCHAANVRAVELDIVSILKKRRRDGEGKLAKRIIQMAVEALETAVGRQISDVKFWNQQGAYRGPKWDLDRWGLDFTFLLDGRTFKGSCSSLATMTQCSRDFAKGLRMVAEKTGQIAFDYDLLMSRQRVTRSQ